MTAAAAAVEAVNAMASSYVFSFQTRSAVSFAACAASSAAMDTSWVAARLVTAAIFSATVCWAVATSASSVSWSVINCVDSVFSYVRADSAPETKFAESWQAPAATLAAIRTGAGTP